MQALLYLWQVMSEKLEEKIPKTRTSFKTKDMKDKPVGSTISFKNADFRKIIDEQQRVLGFKTLNEYVMALLDLSLKDEALCKKLQENYLKHI